MARNATNGRYSKEFGNEAVKMVIEGGLSVYEASRQFSLPGSTLQNWVRAGKAGGLFDIGGQ
ncbi:transposase [Desulfobotulus sp. H1]|uniref:Transposase n=1 Tax=Desulfobotulus pelophilus TaxID=2823377 RepID=A0ABT3N6D0_9BACT|nr:transposase [Desulfobotulus pelophilus]MCW7752999.1 transposase [Desulfobotulus pelophilus]